MKTVSATILLIMMVSCGSAKKETSKTDGVSSSDTSLLGTWKSDCDTDSYSSTKKEITLSQTQIKESVYFYIDNDCSQAAYIKSFISSYSLFDKILMKELVKVTLTPATEGPVSYLNNAKIYGVTGWAVNTPMDITGRIFTSSNPSTEPNKGEKRTDYFKLDKGSLFILSKGSDDKDGVYYTK